jgi:hypothetical protein
VVIQTGEATVARSRNQLGLLGENNRAARLLEAARQCAPSTLPRASSVSAGGRQRRRNTLLLGTVGSLSIPIFLYMSAGEHFRFRENVLPYGDEGLKPFRSRAPLTA